MILLAVNEVPDQTVWMPNHVKWKCAFEHAQNAQIQIMLHMGKVSSHRLLSNSTFCSTQWFC